MTAQKLLSSKPFLANLARWVSLAAEMKSCILVSSVQTGRTMEGTNGVLKPDVDKALERFALDIGDRRVRQGCSLGCLDLSYRRVLLSSGLGQCEG